MAFISPVRSPTSISRAIRRTLGKPLCYIAPRQQSFDAGLLCSRPLFKQWQHLCGSAQREGFEASRRDEAFAARAGIFMSGLANHPFLKMNGLGNEIVVLDFADRPIASHRERRAPSRPRGTRISISSWCCTILCGKGAMPICASSTPTVRRRRLAATGPAASPGRCCMREIGASLLLETRAGLVACERNDAASFTADMGVPGLGWQEIPLSEEFADTRSIELQIGPIRRPDPAYAVSREHGQSARRLLGRGHRCL